ncbi:D-alanyl-D-alanine carboxypeptidase family protein [Streptomyces sp. NPDC002659]|uniref:D-alanyl-D-alanine carboxypeptidase family protein n=1 Tax=Streptomyces sp. NPDC002659 TaxID=3364656 RepID=UPI0036A833CF
MPPQTSLDMLVGLTNATPPKTPLRTTVRRIKPLVLLLFIVFAVQIVRPLPEPSLSLSREAVFTFEGGKPKLPWPTEGQSAVGVDGVGILGTQGAQTPAPIASVAKAMTAYLILRDHPLVGKDEGPLIKVDQQAEEESKARDESTVSIKVGQKFSQKQMLQLLMIPSGNNAARLLARWDSQSEAAFVRKMNAAGKALGMNDTTYTDPSGLKASSVSTPLDQLKLAKTAMRNAVFREIVDTPQVQISGVPGTIYNNNSEALLKPGVNGIKTGSSTPAGGNLLWAANAVVDGKIQRIVGAVFGIQTGNSPYAKLQNAIDASIALIRAAQKSVDSATVVKRGDVVGYVDAELGHRVPVVATKNLKAIGWSGLKVEIKIGGARIPHTVPAGTVVGKVTVGTGRGMVSAPVALQSKLDEPGLTAKITRLG